MAKKKRTAKLPASISGRWYHVCKGCTAKWFADGAQMHCPRCGRWSRSQERQVPPWERSQSLDVADGTSSGIAPIQAD